MAKIQANTITDLQASRVSAPGVNPAAGMASRVGAALAAGAQPYEAMNRNIDNLTRQRVGNIQARNREMQGALGVFARGMGDLGRGAVDVMARRADEQAENALTNYTQYLLAGQDEVYSTAVEGDLAVGPGEIRQQRGVNGPYVAMRKRMSDWDRSDAYRDLSGYAKKLFDEKRRGVDRQFLRGAMERHLAASKAKRDGEEAASLATSIEMAISGGAGITDVGDTSNGWVGNAELAVDKGVRMELRKAHLLDENGEVIEGAEGQAERIREATSDAIYTAIFQRAADRMQQSDDPSERAALYGRLFALVGAKSGHKAEDYALKGDGLDKEQVAEIQKALERASKGYPFSVAAAQKGWDALEKARKGLAQRLEAERRAAFGEAERAAKDLFDAGGDYDGWEEETPATAKFRAAMDALPRADREALRAEIDGWEVAKSLADYSQRIEEVRWASPEDQNRVYKEIEAEIKAAKMPELTRRVAPLLQGLAPRSGASGGGGDKFSAAEVEMKLRATGDAGAEALTEVSRMYSGGEISRDTYYKERERIRTGLFGKTDTKVIFEAAKAAGLDLEGVLLLDEEGMPVLDDNGHFQAADPEETSKVLTYTSTTMMTPGDAFWYNSNPLNMFMKRARGSLFSGEMATVRRDYYEKIRHEVLAKVFDVAADYHAQKQLDPERNTESLEDFMKKRIVRELGLLNETRLRANIAKTEEALRADAAHAALEGAGRGIMMDVGKDGKEE